MSNSTVKVREAPEVAKPADIVPIGPKALLFDPARPCTACRWVRRPLTDKLFGEGDRASCSHPDVMLQANTTQPNCVEMRDYLQPCGPAGRHFVPKR
jgi:hypothetical protein